MLTLQNFLISRELPPCDTAKPANGLFAETKRTLRVTKRICIPSKTKSLWQAPTLTNHPSPTKGRRGHRILRPHAYRKPTLLLNQRMPSTTKSRPSRKTQNNKFPAKHRRQIAIPLRESKPFLYNHQTPVVHTCLRPNVHCPRICFGLLPLQSMGGMLGGLF